jgi:hypothetical protein
LKHVCVAVSITLRAPDFVAKQPWITPAESGMLAKAIDPATTSRTLLIIDADASRERVMRMTSLDNVLAT